QNFTRLLPGAAGSGAGVAVNGNMPYYSNFLADGANVSAPHSANFDANVFESVAEVQVETSTYSAQYGVGGIVMNQISKSGTNQFHGSAYEYFQNDFLNAGNFFSHTTARLRYDNFGGSVGGPVIKNKAFFYFNADKIINNGTSYFSNTYPTAAERAGNFAGLPTIYDPTTPVNSATGTRTPFPNNQIPANRQDSLALKFQTLFPNPTGPGLTNNLIALLPSSSPYMRYFGRADYTISDKNRLTMSVTERDNPGNNPAPDYPLDTTTSDIGSVNAQISDIWNPTANTVNEFRFGYTRYYSIFAPASENKNIPQSLGWNYAVANIAPSINISGTCCSGLGAGTSATYIQNSFDPSDVVTLIRGKHILKFGGEILMYQDNSTPWGNVNAGSFNFSGVFTQSSPAKGSTGGLGYADFLLGYVSGWNASNTPIVGFRQKNPQVFVQDDWKLTPKFTLNLGLRYQIQGAWSETHNRLGIFDPNLTNPLTNTLGAMRFGGNLEAPVYNVLLPRVGFAYSPKTNTAIRGGFGIYAYGWSIDTYSGGSEGVGTNSQGSLTQTNNVNPVFVLGQASYANLNYVGPSRSPSVYNGQSVSYVPYHTPVARNYQYNFSIEQQFGGGAMIQAAYVGSHGTDLSFPVDINQVPANLLAQSAANPATSQSLRPYPQFQGISGNNFNALSWYNSAQFTFAKRMSRGLQFDANYTWSRLLDEQDSSGWGSRDGGQVYQYSYNPRANYGPSNFDIPHMFKGDLTYQLPFGKGRAFMNRGGVLDAVFGGWQASTIFVFESGRPFTFVVGTNNNSGALAGNLYPNVIGNSTLANQTITSWFNTCTLLQDRTTFPNGCSNPAFAIPANGTFGNSGRNTFRGPGIEDVDFSLGKNFAIPLPREKGDLQLRFDAVNGLNHPNFEIPNASIGTSGAGIISGLTGNYNSNLNPFGSRRLQIGARFSF
ncbi:MAG: TonB-dependent receptor, partial [Acidobacteriota bacterium]|nr:TonB-dependent receptor [Acidobacteriota bacterium]